MVGGSRKVMASRCAHNARIDADKEHTQIMVNVVWHCIVLRHIAGQW